MHREDGRKEGGNRGEEGGSERVRESCGEKGGDVKE